MKYKMIYILWRDTCSSSDTNWTEIHKEKDGKLIDNETIGFLLNEFKDRYVVSNSISGNGMCSGTWIINKKQVLKTKIIK